MNSTIVSVLIYCSLVSLNLFDLNYKNVYLYENNYFSKYKNITNDTIQIKMCHIESNEYPLLDKSIIQNHKIKFINIIPGTDDIRNDLHVVVPGYFITEHNNIGLICFTYSGFCIAPVLILFDSHLNYLNHYYLGLHKCWADNCNCCTEYVHKDLDQDFRMESYSKQMSCDDYGTITDSIVRYTYVSKSLKQNKQGFYNYTSIIQRDSNFTLTSDKISTSFYRSEYCTE